MCSKEKKKLLLSNYTINSRGWLGVHYDFKTQEWDIWEIASNFSTTNDFNYVQLCLDLVQLLLQLYDKGFWWSNFDFLFNKTMWPWQRQLISLLILKLREAFQKKLQNLWHPANFNCHLPTLPNYDINYYDKAGIIVAATHLQVIMTNIKINFISSSQRNVKYL